MCNRINVQYIFADFDVNNLTFSFNHEIIHWLILY